MKSNRPDPENPWRYACPECGSRSVQRRYGLRIRCPVCGTHGMSIDDLIDLKNK